MELIRSYFFIDCVIESRVHDEVTFNCIGLKTFLSVFYIVVGYHYIGTILKYRKYVCNKISQ